MILCPKCGKENLPTSKFCQKCGASLAPVSSPPLPPQPKLLNLCPKCRTETLPDSTFCQKCGASLVSVSAPPVSTLPPPSPKPQVEVDKVSSGKSKAPQVLEFYWDGRIRSARELFRLLHDFLNKYGYEHIYHELRDIPGAIEGTATFWDSLTGRKDYKKRNWWLLANSVILLVTGVITIIKGINAKNSDLTGWGEAIPLGILIMILGFGLLQSSAQRLRKSISLRVEGETYRARAEKRGETSSEVYDVVSNCRVVFNGKVGTPTPQAVARAQEGKSDSIAYGVYKLSKKISDWDSLKSEFDSLTADFQSLRPRIEIPAAIAENKKE